MSVPPRPGRALPSLRRAMRLAMRALRAIVGAPDYDRYLEHHRLHHAGAPLSRVDFERAQMERRARPGSRCC